MRETQFTVAPFGNRWIIERGARRLCIQDSLASAMDVVLDLADQATDVGEQARVLVQQREGGWREFVYTHGPDFLQPSDLQRTSYK